MSQVERMQNLFPRCPICDSIKGYKFSAFYPLVACKSCKSEWALYENEMELKATSDTDSARDLLNKKYSFNFWRELEEQGKPKPQPIGSTRPLVHTLRSFQGQIKKLRSEKANLQAEIEKLRKVGEEQTRVMAEEIRALEEEVATLKKESESLKESVGSLA
jgi:SMC interacting uncharacterized protein involved in chromosome segregation